MHSKELHNAVVDSLVFVICRQDRIPDNPSRSVLGGMFGPAGQNLGSVQTFLTKMEVWAVGYLIHFIL